MHNHPVIAKVVADPLPLQGLKDGGSLTLECSACGKALLKIRITNPYARKRDGEPFRWKGQATCCYCGDHSFVAEWEGAYQWGAIAENETDEEAKLLTTLAKIEMQQDKIVFHMKKA
jgi:hypothetical protein